MMSTQHNVPASPSPKRIAVVVPKYGLVGGGEHFASEITARLAQNQGYEIYVLANHWVSNSDRIKFHKVPAIYFPRFLRPLCFAWFVRNMVNRMEFDLVHSHDWILQADIFSVHSVPHAAWVRNVRKKIMSLFDYARISIERRAVGNGKSSWFLPVSTIAVEKFHEEYTPLPGRWQVLPPGVDIERFSAPDQRVCREEIRTRYGIGDNDLLLLFVGMNFEVKGLDIIISALARAKTIRPEAKIRLLVVGRGDEKKYGKIAESLGVEDAVIFAGKQYAGLERFYRAADVFMLFSAFDTFGMVVLEAMAAGLPVIVSPNVGAKDLVTEGNNGFILPDSRDSNVAADRILQLLDAGRRREMGEAAQQTSAQHTWERLTEEMEKLYQNILSRNDAI